MGTSRRSTFKRVFHGTGMPAWGSIQELGYIRSPVYVTRSAAEAWEFTLAAPGDSVVLELDLTGIPIRVDPWWIEVLGHEDDLEKSHYLVVRRNIPISRVRRVLTESPEREELLKEYTDTWKAIEESRESERRLKER